MAIVGVQFNKISAEKKNVVKGKVNITNDLTISKIAIASIPLTSPKQSALSIQFEYKTAYEPEIGLIQINGEVFWVDSSEKNKEALQTFKKSKILPMDIKLPVFNSLLSKCTIESLLLSREAGLPAPIRLPKAQGEPEKIEKTK
jgi:hypothetical protein